MENWLPFEERQKQETFRKQRLCLVKNVKLNRKRERQQVVLSLSLCQTSNVHKRIDGAKTYKRIHLSLSHSVSVSFNPFQHFSIFICYWKNRHLLYAVFVLNSKWNVCVVIVIVTVACHRLRCWKKKYIERTWYANEGG